MTYDVAILGSTIIGNSALTVDNKAAQGIYKLVQRAMLLLLTDEAAARSLGLGTNIPSALYASNNSDPETVQGIFNIAVTQVVETLKQQTPETAPTDEKIKSMVAVVTKTDRGSLKADIEVTSESATVKVTMPLANVFQS